MELGDDGEGGTRVVQADTLCVLFEVEMEIRAVVDERLVEVELEDRGLPVLY